MLVIFGDVDDVSEGGDNVDVNAAEWGKGYPSSLIEFWNDMGGRIYPIIFELSKGAFTGKYYG